MENNQKIANRVGIVTIFWNVVLSIGKLLAGIFGKSTAMISDSIHSLSDVITTIVALVGIKIASNSSDEEHPYGHEKFECIASTLLAFILFSTGAMLGINGIKAMFNNNSNVPSTITIIVAVLSIIIKEMMCRYTLHYAKKISSLALKADAHHHRSDALSSIGALVGIIASICGFEYGDSIASIVISVIICIEAIKIFLESVDKLVDKSVDSITLGDINKLIKSVDGVQRIDNLRTRQFGNKIYIDVDIAVDGDLKLTQAHEIAETVHDRVENSLDECKHIMVHVNPY